MISSFLLEFLSKSNKKLLWIYSVIILGLGLSVVWLDFDAKIDSSLLVSSTEVEQEVEAFRDKMFSLVQSRTFQTNLIFGVNLAATAEVDSLVEQDSLEPLIFVYDANKRYFGKSSNNRLNRFDFKINELPESKISFKDWKFIEIGTDRYIETYLVPETDGAITGYVRILLSLEKLQENLLEDDKIGSHLSVKSDQFAYERCVLNQKTDLLICMPLSAKQVIKQSGTLLAFVILLWSFLVFIFSFYIKGRLAQTRAQTLVEISSQVSHDIQSPLLALKVAMKDLSEIPEERRMMVQRSIERIEDIVNDLRNKRDSNLESKNQQELHLLFGLVNSILSEKRLQFKYRQIELDFYVQEGLQTAFVLLGQQEFKRVLSNLINNAVEAIPAEGNVGIEMDESEGDLVLRVIDNGVGMSPDQILKATEKGVSVGKENGQGLGLYHAEKMARLWGASLMIESIEGKGTTVSIRLPRAKAPAWFAKSRILPPEANIVILDDDQNIHELWVTVLRNQGFQNKLVHFYHIESAERQLDELLKKDVLFLVDYELIHSEKSGLDFIVQNQIQSKSILVTARYDDEKVLRQSLAASVSLLPKVLMTEYPLFLMKNGLETGMNLNPLIVSPKKKTEEGLSKGMLNVLIDDDPLVRKIWQMSAKAQSKDLLVFSDTESFMQETKNLPQNANIYIDVELGDVKGHEWSRKLYEIGFFNLYITTGHDDIGIQNYPWLKDQIGKEPPF